jgi:hypothetical protein
MAADPKLHRRSPFVRRAFLWVTLVLFLGSAVGHWVAGWKTYADEQETHGERPEFNSYVPPASRDTFENWQAEFMSLCWQVFGLTVLYAVGSPQSRESDERKEKKLDLILRKLDPEGADEEIGNLDRDYART